MPPAAHVPSLPVDRRSGVFLYAIVVLVYAASVAILASSLRHHFGFPLDDSWIHQSIGRNFANYGSLGYLPQQRSSGSTSLLWTVILAANYKFLPSISPILFTLALNTLCLFAIGILLLMAAGRDGVSRWLAVLFACAPALDGNFIWLAFTGMEHLLFIMLSLASILLWTAIVAPSEATSLAPTRWTTVLAAGICMGLLGMTRPEGLVLVVLLLIAALFLKRSSFPNAQLAVMAISALLLNFIPFGVNLSTSHSLLPLTLKGRQWMYSSGQGSALHLRVELLQQWVIRPLKSVAVVDGTNLHGTATHVAVLIALIALSVLLIAALWSIARERRLALAIICAWGIVHSLLYTVLLPASGHGGRYQAFQLLLLFPLVVFGLTCLLPHKRSVGTLIATAALIVAGTASIDLWRNVLISGIDHINGSHGVAAQWINRNLPGKTIAVFDIGRIGYLRTGDPRNRPVMDLGGLTDTAYLPYLISGKVPAYLAQHQVDYVILPVERSGYSRFFDTLHLNDDHSFTRQILFRVCTPDRIWMPAWIETRNASQCQEVDRLTYARTGVTH